jgi:hypothetical protein
LSTVFTVLTDLKHQGLISDFSLTRASLEQVFIYFAKFQLGSGFFSYNMVDSAAAAPQVLRA